jgi:hypothetical protein
MNSPEGNPDGNLVSNLRGNIRFGIVLHLIFSIAIVFLVRKEWFKVEIQYKYLWAIHLIGLVIFVGMYIGGIIRLAYITSTERLFWNHICLMVFIVITIPILHMIGWIIIYLWMSVDVHMLRATCYAMGLIFIGSIIFVCGIIIGIIRIIINRINDYFYQRHLNAHMRLHEIIPI